VIVAHLPAGWLMARAANKTRGPVLAAALIGSVLPDFDLLWFYVVDHRAVLHHRYWTHIPGFWVMAAIVVLPLIRAFARRWFSAAVMFFAAILVHLVLDTPVGGIMWLWPFDDHLYRLAEVQQSERHWIATFMMHPSFLAEVAIIAVAAFLLFNERTRRP
jgi:inner membrane protein